MPQIRDNPMQLRVLIQAEDKGGGLDRVKRKLVGRDGLRKIINRGWLFSEYAHNNIVYVRGQEEDICRFQVCRRSDRPTPGK